MFDFIAIAGPMEGEQRRHLLQQMAKASPLRWPIRYLQSDERIGVAILAPSETAMDSAIAWDQAKESFVILQGCLLDAPAAAPHLLRLIQRYGKSFTQRIDGDFAAVLWRAPETAMTLLTDHLGLHPIYYHRRGERLFAATRIAYLLALPDLHPTLDRKALASYLAIEYPLGTATLVEEITLVPPATRLTWQGGTMQMETYWQPWLTEFSPFQEKEQWLEGLLYYLKDAISRRREETESDGLLLSGGLDSRLLAALLTDQGHHPRTYTFGLRDSDDVRWGREVARRLHLHHSTAILQPSHLPTVAEQAVALTEGMTGAVHFHLLWGREENGRWPRKLYLGFLGDALFGSHLSPILWGRYSADDVRRCLFRRANVAFRREDLETLLTPRWYGALRAAAWEAFQEATSTPNNDAAQMTIAFDLWQRQRRFIAQGHRLLRPWHDLLLPFADRKLITYILRIPPGLQLNRELMIAALLRLAPQLGHIPYTGTGLPLIASLRGVMMRAERQLRWRLRGLGLKAVAPPRARPYADYDRWFAVGGALHRWARSVILAPDARLHAIFNRQALERWLGSAHGERRITRQIGLLIALELWMQKQRWL